MSDKYVAVRVLNHPAGVTVYNLHRGDCHWATKGDPRPTTLAEYAEGQRITRATVPPETGWRFGHGSSGGNPNAPVWISTDSLRFLCGHCLRDLRVP